MSEYIFNPVLYYEDRYKSADDIVENVVDIIQEASTINFTLDKKRVSKIIKSKDEIDYLVSIDHDKARCKSTVMDLFADFGNGPKYNPYDIIEQIPAKAYGGLSKKNPETGNSSTKTNSVPITTTVGLWIFNRMFIEPLSDVLGYINKTVNKDMIGELNQTLSYALLEDNITVRQLKDYIDQSQIIMGCCSALAPSHTQMVFAMQEKITKKKQELLSQKKYKEGIPKADLTVMKDMENELLNYAKDLLKDDPCVDMFNSGARSNWGNNFKNMYLMRSGITHTDGHVSIITSSYMDGMDKKDFADISDASVGGPYARSQKTANGGYTERLILGATAHLKVMGEGSDCGTKEYINIELTKGNIKDWYYSFIIDGNKLVELLPSIADKYIGKTVKMRYASLCKAKDGMLCEHCAGSLFRRIGITNVGMGSPIMGSTIKNASMKLFHDQNIKLTKMDPELAFSIK